MSLNRREGDVLRVLELGNYVAPAYAGMILAEQGHYVEKWIDGHDPILSLHRGIELWDWINHGKTLKLKHPGAVQRANLGFDIILDNFRPSTLEKWGVDPAAVAYRQRNVWVSLRSEVGERSFDVVAQARSWMEYAEWVPFYVGDTTAGLWMAFKALSVTYPGHYVLGQASCLQKLVEGELVIDQSPPKVAGRATRWDNPDDYGVDCFDRAIVNFKDETIIEPTRDRAWKLANLWHNDGRITI